ncbi:AMP-binding protein [Rhodococcus opacus]|uniref:AMP-binding protein n=1 Tax=Rhodococcus opacus TaxID=37919 RepID=UPI001650F0F7|nr:AMP-binding protein [Rhodococcus opacus]UDH01288.1 AMP-binding protein [Rhodococcus opacus PD630]
MPIPADSLLVEQRDHVLILTLNRPHVRNAMNADLGAQLNHAFDRFEADPELRVAVLTGTDGFSSGMDLGEFSRTGRPPWATENGLAALLQRRISKPVVAAVERFALAGGLELALLCDLIVASSGTVLGIPEVKRGLVAAGGGLRRLPRALSHQMSAELALTGGTLTAERAHTLGLVNRLTEHGGALTAALVLANEIASHRAVAVAVSKQLLDQQRDWSDDEFWARQRILVDPVFDGKDATLGAAKFVGSKRRSADHEGPSTVPDLIRVRARERAAKVFLRFEDRSYTYKDVDTLTNRTANSLRRLGVDKGTRVALLMKNSPELLWLLWGLGKLGAVAVPLNTEARGHQLAYFLSQSESTTLILDSDLLDVVEPCMPDLPKFENLVCAGPVDRIVPEGLARSVTAVAELLAGESTPVDVHLTAGDLHALNYTSGTTGPSKAAMSPHGQPLAVAQLMAEEFGYRDKDVFYTCLPLFHVNALWYTAVTALWSGASVVLGRKFSATRFWPDVNAAGATVINLLGAMANMLEKQDPTPEERTHSVRVALVAPTTSKLAELLESRYGIQVISLLAATETFPVTVLRAEDVTSVTAGSAGRESRLAEIRIADADGQPVPAGTPGEILVRPRQPATMSMGYWNMPAETVKAIDGLWFHTGDRAYFDDRGYLFFVDRIKEVIRRRGENISSYEVEAVILQHPDVLEAAAIPIESEMSEDEVGVFVVRRPGATLTENELVEYCIPRMAKYMVPRFVHWADELPRTASQKIEKYKLRAMAAEAVVEFWDREVVAK